jgi:hypothetical protein
MPDRCRDITRPYAQTPDTAVHAHGGIGGQVCRSAFGLENRMVEQTRDFGGVHA